MGTFHHGKSALHGITVAVDTTGSTIYVGRCDDEDGEAVYLLDVDQHEEGADGRSKQEWLQRTARFGHWKKHERLVVPRDQVAWIKPLGEIDSSD